VLSSTEFPAGLLNPLCELCEALGRPDDPPALLGSSAAEADAPALLLLEAS